LDKGNWSRNNKINQQPSDIDLIRYFFSPRENECIMDRIIQDGATKIMQIIK
jgi:hypothetical protein